MHSCNRYISASVARQADMREIRICVTDPPLARGNITLTGQAARHLVRVLRQQAGDRVTLFDGAGQSGDAIIRHTGRDTVELELLNLDTVGCESPLQLTLAMAMVRGDQMDLVVQKATELGTTALQPLLTERSVIRLQPSRVPKRLAHWRRLAASACEQSGRNTLPTINAPLNLPEWLGDLGDMRAQELRLVAHPVAGQQTALPTRPASSVRVLVGPEGGFSNNEIQLANSRGFAKVWLGPRILRAETAAISLLSLVQWQLGDLGDA